MEFLVNNNGVEMIIAEEHLDKFVTTNILRDQCIRFLDVKWTNHLWKNFPDYFKKKEQLC